MSRIRRNQTTDSGTSRSLLDALLVVWCLLVVAGFVAYVAAVGAGSNVALELCDAGRYVYLSVVAVCLAGLALRAARAFKN